MSDTVIRVENLGKKYIIGHQQQERYTALRDVLAHKAKGITQLFNPKSKIQNPKSEEFWALKDVSFEVKQGDRIGIIGRNGAGKSTLLKVLSRITEPTEGRISIKGRVASLLEVGTGFHPELTGRENIYLNGAILGMGKVEIRRKFDEIVAFAEVEKFLDTPVKRYSSGMYVRLAFAVAAHLEPEILIVDEVLAVGDAQFQKKCLGKLEDVGKDGRTVLFVSHQMATVTQLCRNAIWLDRGEILLHGEANHVVSQYLSSGLSDKPVVVFEEKATEDLSFTKISLLNHNGEPNGELDVRFPFFIQLDYVVRKPLKNIEMSVRIKASDDIPVFTTISSDCSGYEPMKEPGLYTSTIEVPKLFLMPGMYTLTCAAFEFGKCVYSHHQNVMKFSIAETGTNVAKYNHHRDIGVVLVHLPWIENRCKTAVSNRA
ncbi:ABC transporter ATP-binding protein [Nodosilinea nodulosa]|uniref:ABC transporter ATP-binding protein n=1 Tax=Nodosilinea nodulosa TaxID=416001 RepID=UPI0002E6FB84|nr:ABC transporter ATP-binding protein [Nodosilinea nodulosa]